MASNISINLCQLVETLRKLQEDKRLNKHSKNMSNKVCKTINGMYCKQNKIFYISNLFSPIWLIYVCFLKRWNKYLITVIVHVEFRNIGQYVYLELLI